MNKFTINTVRDNRAFIIDSNKIHQFLCRKNNTSQDAINRFEKRKKDNVMIETLKNYLNEHNIPFNISYGGENHDIENIEVGGFAIIEDIRLMQYEVCDIASCNFMWLDFDEVVNLLTS